MDEGWMREGPMAFAGVFQHPPIALIPRRSPRDSPLGREEITRQTPNRVCTGRAKNNSLFGPNILVKPTVIVKTSPGIVL